QPAATATAGQAFAVQPVIYEEDRYGNVETGDSSTTITASLASGSGALQGTTSVVLKNGVATFTNLAYDIATAIALKFAAGGLSASTPGTINVSAAPATQLVVTTPPPSPIVAGQAFTLVVDAEDPFHNVDSTFNGDVIISLPNQPGFSTTV